MPKVELHAHLSGSIPSKFIAQLLERLRPTDPKLKDVTFNPSDPRDLASCFQLFAIIHKLVQTPEVLIECTREVVKSFADENTRYLELRTTPRATDHMDAESYLKCVMQGVREASAGGRMATRLLISIDRARTVEDAEISLRLALMFQNEGVVGVELSGDPSCGSFSTFEPILRRAREAGLGVSVHFAEAKNYEESRRILEFRPDRLGHAFFIDKEIEDKISFLKIPVECCPTSNMKCYEMVSLRDHVFGRLYRRTPLSVCTDDSGVFETTLSKEWLLIAEEFQLTASELRELTMNSIDMIMDPSIREDLRVAFTTEWSSIF